ncbi:MAG: D-alanyl-D-alanine carboxypeptidase/D-alanyl-D-alanine-endopeptidase [Pyrinomonadaceae bacterium MAG19_C2-C3]|nr:D-alanyl-D-alanine carboxypeptidase/D-alanyl-D-alanine-endopeptidase [Pyrinomonadaceae bacterium MAG19_C2-C3]
MKKPNRTTRILIAWLLIASCYQTSPAPFVVAQVASPAQQRERRAVQPPPTSPTPSPSPPPSTAAPSSVTTPPVAPSPTTAPRPLTSTANAPQTIVDLTARIANIVRRPSFDHASTGVKIVSLDTGKVIYEDNAGKLLTPASNMKSFTVAAALARLTPDFRFKTSALAATKPDANGTLTGDLIIYGRGDPTFAARFYDGNTLLAFDEFAANIAASGVRRITGDIIGDESFFNGAPLSAGWEWDDLQWYYGAEVSALSVNDNAIDLVVKPGGRVGDACIVTPESIASSLISIRYKQSGETSDTRPIVNQISNATLSNTTATNTIAANPLAFPFATILNNATTSEQGTPRRLDVYRPLNSNVIEINGSLPVGGTNFSGSLAVSRPALMFTQLLRQALTKRGITVGGKTLAVDARTRGTLPPATTLIELANRQSPALSTIAAQTLKPSQNLYTELILRALGNATNITTPDAASRATSADAGIAAVQNFLTEAGIMPGTVIHSDGSGLSRSDRITPDSVVRLLTYMDKHPSAQLRTAFRNALPIAGIDGTLRNRMKNTPAAGNVQAKTGTLSNATSLGGYVTTAAGERLAFSLIINNYPADADARTDFTEAIAVLLASFTGRS